MFQLGIFESSHISYMGFSENRVFFSSIFVPGKMCHHGPTMRNVRPNGSSSSLW